MYKKIPITKAVPLVDKSRSMLEYCDYLNHKGKQIGLLFVEQQIGAGFFQWSLPGEGWQSFNDCDETKKSEIAKVFVERCDKMRALLNGSPLQDAVLTVPSEGDFVFVREKDGAMEVALTAWGYKYIDVPVGREIYGFYSEEEYQEVKIGFAWNDELYCDMPFFLDGMPRSTASDGYFRADGPLKVGRQFHLKTTNGHEFPLVVEKGKSDYVYDITQYAQVEVSVTRDGIAEADKQCIVSFNGTDYPLQTDEEGKASIKIPLINLQDGTTMEPQPECKATCDSEVLSEIPKADGTPLCFNFAFATEVAPPPPPPPAPPKMVKIRLIDKDGKPMQNLPIKLQRANAEDLEGCTDADGNAFFPASLFNDGEMVKLVCTAKGRMKLTMLKPDN